MKRLIVVALLLIPAIGLDAAPDNCTANPVLNPMGYESITVGSTAIGFTATVYAPSGVGPADFALVTVETASLRYREDGVNPTTSEGHLVAESQILKVCGQRSIQLVRFIEAVEADAATIKVSYFRGGN